jgi:UDP-N-acetylmuramoyl-tripeptide--D-alanyl-D-alanine ligase
MATPIPRNEAQLTAWEVAAATGGHLARVHGEGRVARGITSDSRAVRPGAAFFALRGEIHDGHAHAPAAVRAGAVLVVVERGAVPLTGLADADVVEVDDTLLAWGAVARAHLRRWRRSRLGTDPARTLCITGSSGKTTTKELATGLLAEVGETLATPGNLNNRIGLPAVALTLEPRHRFAVLEAGMSLPGEIAALAGIAEPDVGLITNVGLAHAEGVGGGRADVGREKGALYAALSRDGTAVVNADDAAALGQLVRTRARDVRSFGRGADATYRLVDRVVRGTAGARVTIERPCADCVGAVPGAARDLVEVELALVGEVAALDLCGALAAVEAMVGRSLTHEEISRGVARVAHVDGRAAVLELADGTLVIDDTYNANPGSVRAALGTLADLAGGTRRTVVVLGEMKEIGETTRAEHEALGAAVAAAHADVLVTCGGLATLIADRAEECGVAVRKCTDVDEAAAAAASVVQPGDVVLVKASRSVKTENVVRALVAKHGKRGGS